MLHIYNRKYFWRFQVKYNDNVTKENKSTFCAKHRTVITLTHTSKILIKIILDWTEKNIDETLAEHQLGFRKKKDTREAILCSRNIVEKSFKVDKKL
jgi:hypothetical protein